MTHLPAVRHAALTHRGVDNRALRLLFERPLEAHEQMVVLAEVGFFHVDRGVMLLPEFPKADIVLLGPAIGQTPQSDDYTAAARHFGYAPTDGHLTFVMGNDIIADMPLMPQ